MSFILEFEIMGLPKLPNQSMYKHWRVKHTEAKKWKALVKTECVSFLYVYSHVPERVALPLEKAKVTLTRISLRKPDNDNLMSSWKHCIDGLVEAGILINDDDECIGQPISLWEPTRKLKEQRIRIKVEAL